jgi:trehalose utilization protein
MFADSGNSSSRDQSHDSGGKQYPKNDHWKVLQVLVNSVSWRVPTKEAYQHVQQVSREVAWMLEWSNVYDSRQVCASVM